MRMVPTAVTAVDADGSASRCCVGVVVGVGVGVGVQTQVWAKPCELTSASEPLSARMAFEVALMQAQVVHIFLIKLGCIRIISVAKQISGAGLVGVGENLGNHRNIFWGNMYAYNLAVKGVVPVPVFPRIRLIT